jgi:hypothetical protein
MRHLTAGVPPGGGARLVASNYQAASVLSAATSRHVLSGTKGVCRH